MNTTPYLTTTEAAAILGISPRTLLYHVRDGNIVPDATSPQNPRPGGRVQNLFLRETVEAFALVKRPRGNPDIANLAKTRRKKSEPQGKKTA